MKYATPRAFRAALEQRLRNDASPQEGPADAARLSRLRKRVTFERFLARLHCVRPDGWVLKGGFALELRLADLARTTKDIDIDWMPQDELVVDLLLDAADADLGDHFVLDLERIELPVGGEEEGQRWRIVAQLDGREFETVLLDIGLAGTPVLAPVELPLPDTLGFADLPRAIVPTLPIEQHLAEKVHAYTRLYGPKANTPSSRVKDLVDMALIAASLPVDGASLGAALERVFDARAMQPLPARLPAPPRTWERPWRDQAPGSVPDDVTSGHAIAAKLVDPALSSRAATARWSPGTMSWMPLARIVQQGGWCEFSLAVCR
jgi:hypothetical protein